MITGICVIDASAVIDLLVDFGEVPGVGDLLAALRGPEPQLDLWAPDLVMVECASALRSLEARKAISTQAATRAVDQLGRLPISLAGAKPLLPSVWKFRGAISAYDATYVGLAASLEAPLLTSDEKLARARPRGGPRIITLAELGSP